MSSLKILNLKKSSQIARVCNALKLVEKIHFHDLSLTKFLLSRDGKFCHREKKLMLRF